MSRDHRFVAFLIAVLTAVACACGTSPSAPTATGPIVSGLVLDFQTNAIVSGVTVGFGIISSSGATSIVGQSVTDGSGSYRMSLSAGRYLVFADNASVGLALVRSGVNRTDLLVHPNGCIVRYGTIADSSTGRPLAGATVSLVRVTGTSGSDGTYRLDFGCQTGLWSNSICISVTRAGYQDACVPMGRGENLSGVLRQDVDLDPR
jgi:hypothetical protein